MKNRFTIFRRGPYAVAIRYGRQWVAHLIVGTMINEHYCDWLAKVLNGSRAEPPEPPKP